MSYKTTAHSVHVEKERKRIKLPLLGIGHKLARRSRKKIMRYSLVLVNLLVLVGVSGFVILSSGESQVAKQNALVTGTEILADPLDQLSASDVAVHVAQLSNLPEASAVREQADTISGQLAISSSDSQLASRPQIVSTDARSYRDIKTYTVKQGEKLSKIANKFGVTSESIMWSNDLDGDEVSAGRVLYIPPVNGIVHLIEAGDSVASLAEKFNVEVDTIKEFNDTSVRGLPVGQRVMIPGGVIEQTVSAPTTSYYSSGGTWSSPNSQPLSYSGNAYTYGYCTWHAFNRRAAAGNPIPSNLGNAISWYSIASSSGIPVGSTPRAGAVLWHANLGGLGHVGYVERVNSDGSILVSDMNYPSWGRVTYRTISPAEFGNYRFIY